MIAVSDLGKSYGGQTLFEGVSLAVQRRRALRPGRRQRLGQVDLPAHPGRRRARARARSRSPSGARSACCARTTSATRTMPILDVAMMGNHDAVAGDGREGAPARRTPSEQFDADRYAELEDVILRHDGYTARGARRRDPRGARHPEPTVHREPLSTLSGGFKLRVLLAQVLAAAPDVLLLDEPTNHLDILSIRWLEKFLVDYHGLRAGDLARPPLPRQRLRPTSSTSTTRRSRSTTATTPTSWQPRSTSASARRPRSRSSEKEIAHHQEFVDRFRAKATKARQAQSEDEADREASRSSGCRRARAATRPSSSRSGGRAGKEVLEVEGIAQVVRREAGARRRRRSRVQRGDRLAIIGPNGIGKSTLLKIAGGRGRGRRAARSSGATRPTPATSRRTTASSSSEPRPDGRELALGRSCPGEPIGFVRGQLGAGALLRRRRAKKPSAALSGGEAARLVFAQLGGREAERAGARRAHQPPRPRGDRGAGRGAQEVRRHADLRLPRPLVRVSSSRPASWRSRPTGIRDFHGTYEEYLERLGDDHLDADARAGAGEEGEAARAGGGRRRRGRRASGTGSARRSARRARRPGGRSQGRSFRRRRDRRARTTPPRAKRSTSGATCCGARTRSRSRSSAPRRASTTSTSSSRTPASSPPCRATRWEAGERAEAAQG